MAVHSHFLTHYGFSIEVHKGGKRAWPPSFKRFIRSKIDDGSLTVNDVVRECNVSKSLVYKWRFEAKENDCTSELESESLFAPVVMESLNAQGESLQSELIILQVPGCELRIPQDYPVPDLISLVSALKTESTTLHEGSQK